MRIALGVEYDGSGFHGWQFQPHLITLQSTIEQALSKVADEPISVICAGRTDAGVHATHQVIHFETKAQRNLKAWVFGTNYYLPRSMTILWAKPTDESFHARFSALSRRYQYLIFNNPVRSSLFSSLLTGIHQPLDEAKMAAAANYLIGEHDFSSFRSAECQSSTPMRHVYAANVSRKNDCIIVDIIANSFLHHMVRNIVGVLIDIGIGRRSTEWCQELIVAKDRKQASRTAPPYGLYLTGVYYADSYNLPSNFKPPTLFSG